MKSLIYTGFTLVIFSQGMQIVHNYFTSEKLNNLENRIEILEQQYQGVR